MGNGWPACNTAECLEEECEPWSDYLEYVGLGEPSDEESTITMVDDAGRLAELSPCGSGSLAWVR